MGPYDGSNDFSGSENHFETSDLRGSPTIIAFMYFVPHANKCNMHIIHMGVSCIG